MKGSATLQNNLSLLAKRGTLSLRDIEWADPHGYDMEESDEDMAKWASCIKLSDLDVLFVFGSGMGRPYPYLKEWLRGHRERYLVFLECDLSAARAWLEQEDASGVLRDPQVKLFLCHTDSKNEVMLNWCYTFFAGLRAQCVALPSYQRRYPGKVEALADRIGPQSFDTSVILMELFQNCAHSLGNIYPNVMRLPDALWGDRLYGQFQGVPAIICGAGGSLRKNVELLAALENRALIFSPGSALNALNRRGIQPHFGAGADPNPEQLERLESNSAFETPILYGNRWQRSILPNLHGPKLFISGMGMHDFENWIEERVGIAAEKPIIGGHSATHLCLEIARRMGCNPLILVGQDLAYSDGLVYDQGVGAHTGVTPDALEKGHIFFERPVLRKDQYGNDVYTAWKWILEARWLTRYVQKAPDIHLIQATEGGLYIDGVEHRSLAEVRHRYLTRSWPLREKVRELAMRSRMPASVSRSRLAEAMGELRASLDRGGEAMAELVDELRRMRERDTIPASLRSGRAALAESEWREELCHELIFERLLAHVNTSTIREVERIRQLEEGEQRREFLRLDTDRYEFVLNGIRIHQHFLSSLGIG